MTAVAQAAYVFGIVPAGTTASGPDLDGIDIVADGPVAAVIGSVPADSVLGAADLRRHDQVIAALVADGVAVLPMRFGAAVVDRDAVRSDVLAPNTDRYVTALDALTGLVQFTVQVRYERTGVVREIVAGDPEVAAARIAASQPAASMAAKLRLGELVVASIERRRARDADRISAEISPLVRDLHVSLGEDPDSVAQIACLVSADAGDEFVARLEELARECATTMRLRLLGPLAPYDFVPTS
jgi:hypothetical protein